MTRPHEHRADSDHHPSAGEELRHVIQRVRRRWRARHALRGLLLTGGAGVAALILVRLVLDGPVSGMSGGATWATVLAAGAYLAVAVVALRALILPLLRRVDDARVALYLEEHEPELEARIVTAVEAMEEGRRVELDPLLARLVRSAEEGARRIDGGRRVDRLALRRLGGATAAAAAVLALLLLIDVFGFRTSLPELARPWTAVEAAPVPAILLTPGDTVVPRGAELRFSARLHAFESEAVEVAFRSEGETRWERWPMLPDEGDPEAEAEYAFVLFRVDEPLEYFVEAEGVRSPVHRVDVEDLPYVSALELEVYPPAYTGMPMERIERGSDLAVLPGTRVRAAALPTVTVAGARLLGDGVGPVEMAAGDEGRLVGEFTVQRAGTYRIELDDAAGTVHRGTPDYRIDVLEDLPPVVSFSRPGRDARATSIEEVFVEARAADDHGIARLELAFSVNGGEERIVPLLDGADGRLAEVSAGHTFFLEEFDLEPGDLVAYHARARDVGPGAEEREARTDLFFIQVEPFDREFRQSEESPGGMQGQGQQGGEGGQLSRRQRDVVTATFNVQRDRRSYSEQELAEAITTIALAQGRLLEEVQGLVRRFAERGVVATDPEMARVAEALPEAAAAMAEALEVLEEGDPEEALPPEQRALQHLLRAEAAFREVQLSWSPQQQQQGGGGGGDPGEDLADFFDLEMDRMRNQYEALQRGEREAADQAMDEAQERLQELARRQQQESERLRRAAEQLPQGAAAGGDSQRRLADETEELARQLERLSREQSSPEMAQSAQRLRQAAESMRRSAATRDERGIGQAREAAEALEEARRLLDRSRNERMDRDAQAVEDRMRRALERQERIQQGVEALPDDDPAARRQATGALDEQKVELREEIDGLQEDLRRLSRETSGEDREAARAFEEAANTLRDDRIGDRIEFSRGLVGSALPDRAREFEEDLTERIRDVADRVAEAGRALADRPGDPAGEMMDRTRELLRGAESMAERTRQTGQANPEAGADADPDMARQLRREAAERAREAEALGEAMAEQGLDASAMNRVASSFRSLSSQAPYGDLEGLEQLQREVIESLRELDFVVRRHFVAGDQGQGVVTGTGEVPESYRALVEEYFRNLARPGGGGG